MPTAIPTLGKEGFIEDIDNKIDYLMCCYFFSKYSQSVICRNTVISLGKDIQKHGNNEVNLREAIESSLRAYLIESFATVEVSVKIEDSGDEPGIKLLVEAIVSDADTITPNSVSVGYSLMTRDSKLKSIINALTGESLYQS